MHATSKRLRRSYSLVSQKVQLTGLRPPPPDYHHMYWFFQGPQKYMRCKILEDDLDRIFTGKVGWIFQQSIKKSQQILSNNHVLIIFLSKWVIYCHMRNFLSTDYISLSNLHNLFDIWLGHKNCLNVNFLDTTFFGTKRILDPNNFWVQKCLGHKNVGSKI